MHPSAEPSESSQARPPATSWMIAGHRVRDPRPGVPATIDLDAPGTGILLGDAKATAADHLLGLGLEPHWRLVDHWPRGSVG